MPGALSRVECLNRLIRCSACTAGSIQRPGQLVPGQVGLSICPVSRELSSAGILLT